MIDPRTPRLLVGALLFVGLARGPAVAGVALDDDKKPAPSPALDDAPKAGSGDDANVYGVGLRLRNVRIPTAVLELFLERAAGGASNVGYGLELVRRRGTFEVQLGLEFEHLTVTRGYWLDKGKSIPADEVDFVQDGAVRDKPFGWFTIDFTFINHAPLTKWMSLRYGGGAGLGILTGEVTHIDRRCTGATYDTCTLDTMGGVVFAYDLPPVFPVVTGLLGLQFTPLEHLTINLEGGLRTVPFLGMSSNYFF